MRRPVNPWRWSLRKQFWRLDPARPLPVFISRPVLSIFRSTASRAWISTTRARRLPKSAGLSTPCFATGVTRCLPTVITGPPEAMLASLRNLRRAQMELPHGRAIAGFHVEGPHIGPEDGPRGAHPARWVRPPDLEEFARWQDATDGNIRLVTLSPHWPEAPSYISAVTKAGVVASIGHTGANAEQIARAVGCGCYALDALGKRGAQDGRRSFLIACGISWRRTG